VAGNLLPRIHPGDSPSPAGGAPDSDRAAKAALETSDESLLLLARAQRLNEEAIERVRQEIAAAVACERLEVRS
jgi:hypothetical protein